ncbi:MAG: hypothetical protein R2873_01745 [Caldilineaceae bacterium]
MSGEKFVPQVDAPADTEANNDGYWFVFQNDRLVVVQATPTR